MRFYKLLHGKNSFIQVSKNLARFKYKNRCLDQNNYIGSSNVNGKINSFHILAKNLSVLQNYSETQQNYF